MAEEDGCSSSMTEPQLEAGGDKAADGMRSTADSSESGQDKPDKVDLESNVELKEDVRDLNLRQGDVVRQGLFQNEEEEDGDSGTDYFNTDIAGTQLQRAERIGDASLPDTFQTNELLYYERFKAYQDYMLGDCKTSEVKAFTADYLEKVLEPCDWQAQWCTDVFDVLVEVVDVNYKELKAQVKLVVPLQCETRGCELTEEAMNTLLEATLYKLPLQELHVVFDESGDFDQTALALEHLRFFYKHIWRKWDDEDEDDDFDYFVRCVEPRLRLFYDILEDRVPAGLVAEYHSLLERCSQKFQEFSSLRNGISSDSESELDNVSMVDGLRMYEQMEALKRKLRIIENPLLRYVLGYKVNSGQQSCRAKGPRASGGRMVHVVSVSTTVSQLQSLMADKLGPEFSGEEFELQFHSEPLLAVSACYEGDVVIILPGHYNVNSSISIPDSISVEGFGLPDEVVIEKKNKGDSFVESTGADVKISNVKFIQHDAIEGILCVRQGKLEMENCVLQCETTGVIVRTSAHLTMNMCDLYGSKGAGVEIYPGSVCSMVGNGIHHCKEGILIKDFADELDTMPKITMVNNVIHNNEGYGVILVKPSDAAAVQEDIPTDEPLDKEEEGEEEMKGEMKMQVDVDVPLIVVDDCSVKEPVSYSSCYDVPPEFTEGNDAIKRELVATSAKKQRCQKSRLKELGVTQADDNLLSQEMFVSIQDNQFRRNGMGSFGTFLY
ncbi:SHC SH2 domain-binding protein 1 [Coregonus clupeaformis]|uniref:SHC SH2 domain-binding protein 1 n=1 Tax=Coregonus clupeaformis TaxID=59861 RepID=UPI001BE0A605|nr:SHC SH2 domain-binding protein 1 [Coregonus clupeaformis]